MIRSTDLNFGELLSKVGHQGSVDTGGGIDGFLAVRANQPR
jgi:hypothetical protein